MRDKLGKYTIEAYNNEQETEKGRSANNICNIRNINDLMRT